MYNLDMSKKKRVYFFVRFISEVGLTDGTIPVILVFNSLRFAPIVYMVMAYVSPLSLETFWTQVFVSPFTPEVPILAHPTFVPSGVSLHRRLRLRKYSLKSTGLVASSGKKEARSNSSRAFEASSYGVQSAFAGLFALLFSIDHNPHNRGKRWRKEREEKGIEI